MSKTVLNITSPCMIVGAVTTGNALPEVLILRIHWWRWYFTWWSLPPCLAVPPTWWAAPRLKGVWRFALAFPNVGFIGPSGGGGRLRSRLLLRCGAAAIPLQPAQLHPGAADAGRRAALSLEAVLATPSIVASVISLAVALTRTHLPASDRGECWTWWAIIPCPWR